MDASEKTAEFIRKAREVHGDRYDYSRTVYVRSGEKVCIVCPEHGEFWQTPNSHLNGHGCPDCAGLRKRTTETFIEKAKEVHGDRYDYSKTEYVNKRGYVTITCRLHGDFQQRANNHLRGQGCPMCAKEESRHCSKNNYERFIKESINRFGDRYEFPNIKSEYVNSHSKITIKCRQCGNMFQKIACDHLTSSNGGCVSCFGKISKPENDIFEYVSGLIGKENVIKNDRDAIKPYEIDIYIPLLKVGIEYNGLIWHSEMYKSSKDYHLRKTELCDAAGIRLIQVFEDEYFEKGELVLKKIAHIMSQCSGEKVYARKTSIHEIDYRESYAFLEKNHIQGGCKATVYLGCFLGERLVGVMCFKRLSKSGDEWELNRFATDNDSVCCGVGGKMFRYFTEKYHPSYVKSFADRRWSVDADGNLYRRMGFLMEGYTRPDYRYVRSGECKRVHKFNFRKKILQKNYTVDVTKTESEICKDLGFYKVWDCGLIKYVWRIR